MIEKVVSTVKNQALPLSMLSGVAGYMLFRFVLALAPVKPLADWAEAYLMPALVFIMLFMTFCKVDPKKMRIRRRYVAMLVIQTTACLCVALSLYFFTEYEYKIVLQEMLVCPTAAAVPAVAVIAGGLGGNETTLTTYTMISNLASAVRIPAIFPLVEEHAAGSFLRQFLIILRRVFPLLICPFLAAWGLCVFFPKIHRIIVRFCSGLTFCLWAVSLIIATRLTLRPIANSPFEAPVMRLLATAALIVCIRRFGTRKAIG
jgi:BASS family bile acid:Na+ symporter